MGNYESLDVHVSFSRDVEPGEPLKIAFDRVYGIVKNQLAEKAARAKEEFK